MTDESDNGKTRRIAPLGILGAVAAIVSVWWFALRPRGPQDDEK